MCCTFFPLSPGGYLPVPLHDSQTFAAIIFQSGLFSFEDGKSWNSSQRGVKITQCTKTFYLHRLSIVSCWVFFFLSFFPLKIISQDFWSTTNLSSASLKSLSVKTKNYLHGQTAPSSEGVKRCLVVVCMKRGLDSRHPVLYSFVMLAGISTNNFWYDRYLYRLNLLL